MSPFQFLLLDRILEYMILAEYLYPFNGEREKETFIFVEICLFNTYHQVSVFWDHLSDRFLGIQYC